MKRRAWAWKAAPLRWLVASLLPPRWFTLFGCLVVGLFGRPGLDLSLFLSRDSRLGQSFPRLSAVFFFVPRNNLEHFLALSFPQSECGPQAETPNTSHIWIYVMPLIGCCADAMVAPFHLSLSLCSSLAWLPSISYEIEFGGGQRLKNTSGKVCAGLASWLAGCLPLPVPLPESWATASAFLPAIKSKFFWPPSSGIFSRN